MKRLWAWLWFDCPRHGAVLHCGKGRCAICGSRLSAGARRPTKDAPTRRASSLPAVKGVSGARPEEKEWQHSLLIDFNSAEVLHLEMVLRQRIESGYHADCEGCPGKTAHAKLAALLPIKALPPVRPTETEEE